MNPPTGPLTHGQISVLRSMVGLSWERQADANIVNVWQLSGKHSQQEISGAWSALIAANQSLRSRYYLNGQSSSQAVDPPEPARLSALEVGETEALVTEVADEWAAHPLDLSVRPWRAFIATHQGQPRFLATVIHHVVTDGTAAGLLQEQFYRALAGEPLQDLPQPLDLALAQQSDHRELARRIAHWSKVWPELEAADRIGVDTSQRIGADLFSAAALTAARTVAQRHGVSLQSVILAVAAIALSRMNGRTRLTFGLMAANRFDPRWAAIVSSMNQLAPLTVAPEPGRDVGEYLSDVFSRGLEAYQNGCYDLDRLRVFLTRVGHANPDPIAFDVYYNFVGEVPDAPMDDDPVVTSVAWTPYNRFSGSRLSISAGVSTGGLVLNARASQLYLPGDGAGRLLCAVEGGLLYLAAAEPARVGAIQLAPRRAIGLLPELENVGGGLR